MHRHYSQNKLIKGNNYQRRKPLVHTTHLLKMINNSTKYFLRNIFKHIGVIACTSNTQKLQLKEGGPERKDGKRVLSVLQATRQVNMTNIPTKHYQNLKGKKLKKQRNETCHSCMRHSLWM